MVYESTIKNFKIYSFDTGNNSEMFGYSGSFKCIGTITIDERNIESCSSVKRCLYERKEKNQSFWDALLFRDKSYYVEVEHKFYITRTKSGDNFVTKEKTI